MNGNKYTYYKVIQQNYGYGWDDVDFYETNSRYFFESVEDKKNFKENLRLYRTELPYPVRVVHRKEKTLFN